MNSENYDLAQSSLDGFSGNMNTAETAFNDALSAAQDLNENDIADAARAGQQEAQHLGDAGQNLQDAARLASNGNFDEAETKVAQSQTSLRDARDAHQNVMDPSDVESQVM